MSNLLVRRYDNKRSHHHHPRDPRSIQNPHLLLIVSLLKLNNFPTMKSFAECPPLFLALLLLALPQNEYTFVHTHFVFTELLSKGNNDQDVHIFFRNP